VGLDPGAAKSAFSRYLDGTTFSATQIRFINQIIDYLTQKGTMDPELLFRHPFDALNSGLFKEEEASNIIEIVRNITKNAEVA
jgi:type I restriction enzyme, R subunit